MKVSKQVMTLAGLVLLSTQFAHAGVIVSGVETLVQVGYGVLILLGVVWIGVAAWLVIKGGSAFKRAGKDVGAQGSQGSSGPDNMKAAWLNFGGGVIMFLMIGIIGAIASDFMLDQSGVINVPTFNTQSQ